MQAIKEAAVRKVFKKEGQYKKGKEPIRHKANNHSGFYLPIALAAYPSVRGMNDNGRNQQRNGNRYY